MCKAFSCIVTKTGKVYYKVGINSHDDLIEKFHIRELDDEIDKGKLKFARVEIVPEKGYLYPESKWNLQIDERVKPDWWAEKHEVKARKSLVKWKEKVYSKFNLEEARNPINPLLLAPQEVTQQDKDNLKLWASVRDSVWASVWASVGDSVGDSVRDSVRDSVQASVWDSVGASVGDSVWDSVRDSARDSVWDSVWDSVRAYIGSIFPNIKKWKYAPKTEGYPYQSCIDLWKRGFVPSYDGKVWRLHSGKDAKIVYELKEER